MRESRAKGLSEGANANASKGIFYPLIKEHIIADLLILWG